MLVAKDITGLQVLAWRAHAGVEHFCPECGEPVYVRDPEDRVTHYCHYPSSSCSYGTGEGERHWRIKAAVMDEAADFPDVAFEKEVVPGRRADVVIPGPRVVVECQVSPMSSVEWMRRTHDYSVAGYSILWLWDARRIFAHRDPQELDFGVGVPREIVLCHRACYGQVSVYSPETGGWYSVHLTRETRDGNYVGRDRRRPVPRLLDDSKPMIKKSNLDGLRLVNLAPVWWKERSLAA